MDMRVAIASEGLKALPPVAVTAIATVNNWTISDWLALSTICYIALQAMYLIYKWVRDVLDRK